MKNYYEENSKKYIEKTKDCNMKRIYNSFLKYVKNNSIIMDLGFGSGRDSLYFDSLGYNVISIDNVDDFIENAKKIGLKNVIKCDIKNITYVNYFDAIFASASLLHINKDELANVFVSLKNTVKDNGIIYCSFKYGNFEGYRDERYYVDMDEKTIIDYIGKLNVLEIFISEDVRNNGAKWLNVILKKENENG